MKLSEQHMPGSVHLWRRIEPRFSDPDSLALYMRMTKELPDPLNFIGRQEAAVPMFTMALRSAIRIEQSLTELGQAVENGTYYPQAFRAIQQRVLSGINMDPVYILAKRYWEKQGKQVPGISRNEQENQENVLQAKEIGHVYYDNASHRRLIPLLEGTTPDHPLSLHMTAFLMHPHILNPVDAITATRGDLAELAREQKYIKGYPVERYIDDTSVTVTAHTRSEDILLLGELSPLTDKISGRASQVTSDEGTKITDSQKLAALSLSNILRYRDPPPSIGEVKAHPGAAPLFIMARDSAFRILTELSGISQAVEEGKFDRQAFEVTQRQVTRHVGTDLIFVTAAKFWRERGKEILLVSDWEKDDVSESGTDEQFIFDGYPYKGRIATVLRLLTGATPEYPLTISTIASLLYPGTFLFDEARHKTRTITSSQTIKQILTRSHPNYLLHTVETDARSKKYFISSDTPIGLTKHTSSDPESVDSEHAKPAVKIMIHDVHEYVQVDDNIVPISRVKGGISQQAMDGLNILKYLNQYPARYVSPDEINTLLKENNLYNSEDLLESRSKVARKWIAKNITYYGKTAIKASSKGYKLDVALYIQSTQIPLVQATREAAEKDPEKVTVRELNELYETIGNRNIFSFSSGSRFVGTRAIMTYLLLSMAPRNISIQDLQEIHSKEIAKIDAIDFYKVFHDVKNNILKYFPESQVVTFRENGLRYIKVEGYNGEIDLEIALSERIPEIIIYSSFNKEGSTGKNIIPHLMTDDPEMNKALDNASSIINIMRHGGNIQWSDYTEKEHTALLTVIAYELGKPVSMINIVDLELSYYELLGNKGLSGFYRYISNSVNTERSQYGDIIKLYFERLGTKATAEDIAAMIKNDKNVPWTRALWGEIYRLVDFGAEERKIPIEYIRYGLYEEPFTFLDGRNLKRLWKFVDKHPERKKDETPTQFLRRRMGLPDILPGERIRHRFIEMDKSAQALAIDPAQEIPPEILLQWTKEVVILYKNFFHTIEAKELQTISHNAAIAALNEGVRSRGHFISAVQSHLEQLVKASVIKEVSKGTRAQFMTVGIQGIAQELTLDPSQMISERILMEWTERIAKLYKSGGIKAEISDIQNEVYIATVETIRSGITDLEEFIPAVQDHLEMANTLRPSRSAHEIALDSPIFSENKEGKTLAGNIAFDLADHFVLPVEWQIGIARLSHEQQFLIYGTILEKEFSELTSMFEEKFGRAIDVDELQELFEDAKLVLRKILTDDEE